MSTSTLNNPHCLMESISTHSATHSIQCKYKVGLYIDMLTILYTLFCFVFGSKFESSWLIAACSPGKEWQVPGLWCMEDTDRSC